MQKLQYRQTTTTSPTVISHLATFLTPVHQRYRVIVNKPDAILTLQRVVTMKFVKFFTE